MGVLKSDTEETREDRGYNGKLKVTFLEELYSEVKKFIDSSDLNINRKNAGLN